MILMSVSGVYAYGKGSWVPERPGVFVVEQRTINARL